MPIKGVPWGELDSRVLRDILAIIQADALEGRVTSNQRIAALTGRSTSVVARYLRALRKSRHITYADKSAGTIRVREWL